MATELTVTRDEFRIWAESFTIDQVNGEIIVNDKLPTTELSEIDKLRIRELTQNFEDLFQDLINQGKMPSQKPNIILAGLRELVNPPAPVPSAQEAYEKAKADSIARINDIQENKWKNRPIVPARVMNCPVCDDKQGFFFRKYCVSCKGTGKVFE